MPRKPKFKPMVSRVKLNYEQAVLACTCHSAGRSPGWHDMNYMGTVCPGGGKTTTNHCNTYGTSVASS